MARIPVSEIPNAPGVGPAPPTAPYGKVPGAVFANQSTAFTPMQGRSQLVDFNKYAAGLQQKELPGGFAEGAAMVSAAAGRYASVAGEGTARAAQSISNSLNAIGSIMTDAANKANASKDAVDVLRYQDLEQQSKTAFETQMMKDKVPVEQWAEKWQTEGAPRFLSVAENLGTTPATRAKIQAKAAGYVDGQTVGYEYNVQKKILEDSSNYLNASYEQGAKEKNAAKMHTAITEMEAQHFITPDMAKVKTAEADRVGHLSDLDYAMEHDPVELRDNAIAARDRKATGAFAFLNDDPALATQTSRAAAAEVNIRQQEKYTEFSNRIMDKDPRLTKETVRDEAKKAGMDAAEITKLEKQLETDPIWNSQAVASASDAVAQYDPRADVDPKTKLPSIEGYKKVLDAINDNVPKEYRKPYLEEVNRKRAAYLKGEKQDPMEARKSDYYADLQKKFDDGLMGDTGLDKHGKLKKDEKSIQANADTFKKKTQLQNDVDALFERSKEEKWSVPKMDEEYRKLLGPHMSTQAGQAIYRKAVPELPPVAPEEQKAREAPVAVPVSVGYPISGAENVAMRQGTFGGRLANKENTFLVAANKYGVDVALLSAIALHETAKGTSAMLAERNNPGGLFNSETNEYMRFASVDEGIDAMAANLKKNYIDKGLTTIEQIQKEYAPINAPNDPKGLNKDWAPGVRAFYDQLKGSSQQKTSAIGPTTGKPAHVTASISNVVNKGAPNEMIQGTLAVAGKPYEYRSGGYGRGDLPPGEYIVTEHQYSRDTPGMTVGDVGFSFALSDKYDKRVGGTRSLLRIHPDGGTAGTAGCIGIVGGKDVQKKFRDDMTAQIRANGGKLRLVVG